MNQKLAEDEASKGWSKTPAWHPSGEDAHECEITAFSAMPTTAQGFISPIDQP